MTSNRRLHPRPIAASLYLPKNTRGKGLRSAGETIKTEKKGFSNYIKIEDKGFNRFFD